MIARRRDGTLVETYDGEKGAISFLYEHPLGRQLLKLLVQPWVSRVAGAFLSIPLSRVLIGPFVKKNQIDLGDYPEARYRSFNEFFSRRIIPSRRLVFGDTGTLIAPCDGKLTAIEISGDNRFTVKGVTYTLDTLLRSRDLAEKYRGGTLLLFRLTVDDYHRYCWPFDGVPGKQNRIQGLYHTVNPLAAEKMPIYRENTREYLEIETEHFGTALVMEVGALLVGKIRNHPLPGPVHRGQEKGYFQFGGSTVILLLGPEAVQLDQDIINNSRNGEETVVKMGEQIGYATKIEATV